MVEVSKSTISDNSGASCFDIAWQEWNLGWFVQAVEDSGNSKFSLFKILSETMVGFCF